jgi:hypothetical protein
MKNIIKAIAIVSLVFLITGIAGSFIYDQNDEAGLETLFRGLYLNTPIPKIDFGGFKGISFFYVFLYAKCDLGINYFGVSLILLNWLAFVLLLFILLKKGPDNKIFWSLVFLLLAFYNIFIVSLTTTSIFACFAGQLLFLYALTDIESIKIRIPITLLSSLLIVFAYLVRPTSGILAFILFAPVLLWHILFREKAGKKALSLLVIFPFIVSVLIVKQIDKKTDFKNEFDFKVIDIFTKIVDFGYTLNVQNKTQEKLLYEIKEWFFADKDTQKIKEYENLLVRPQRLSNIKNAGKYVFISLVNRRSLVFLCIIAVGLFLLFLLKLKNAKVMIFYLSIGYYFGVLIAIALLMKMPPRILIPILLIAIYYMLITLPTFWQYKKQKINRFIFGTLLIVFISLMFYQAWSLSKDVFRERHTANKCLEELNKYLISEKPENIFMTWAYDLNYYPLKHIKWNPGVKLVPIVGWMSYYPQTYSYLKRLTGSNDIKDIFKWIAAHPDQATIYSDRDNNLVLKKIFAYHDIRADLLPTKILNKESGKGFYRVSFNEL